MSWTNRCEGSGYSPRGTKIAKWAKPEQIEVYGENAFTVGICRICGKESRLKVNGTMRNHVNSALAKTQREESRLRARDEAVEGLIRMLAESPDS